MGRLLTRWINPNKRKFRRNSSTVPVTGLSSVGTFDTEGQFYDFIDEYVTDDGIPFYISVSEPEEGSDLEYAYLLPYVADFIDAEPDYNTMWEPEYKDYKVAIDFRNRKPQAKQKILNTILAKGLPAAFGAGKSQTIESQQIDESESQSTQIVSPDQIDPNETYEKWSWNDGWITKLRGSETGKSVLDKWNQLVKVNIANETNAAPFKGTKVAFFPKGVEPNADYIELEFYNKEFEPESSTLGQKPSWLTVDKDAFDGLKAYSGRAKELESDGITNIHPLIDKETKGLKLSHPYTGAQITLLPIRRRFYLHGVQTTYGKKSSAKSSYYFLPIETLQVETGKLTLVRVFSVMQLEAAESRFLSLYKRITKKSRAKKAQFAPAKGGFGNRFGLGLNMTEMFDFEMYLGDNPLVIDAVAATIDVQRIRDQFDYGEIKNFKSAYVKPLIDLGIFHTYLKYVNMPSGTDLFLNPEEIDDGVLLDKIQPSDLTNALALVGFKDGRIFDIIDNKFAAIPKNRISGEKTSIDLAKWVRRTSQKYPERYELIKAESLKNEATNQSEIAALAQKGAEIVQLADESAEQSNVEPPKSMQIVKFTDFEPEQLYKGWRWTNNSWESTGFPTEKGSQQTPSNWNQYVEYFKGRRDSKTAVFPAGYTPTTERYIEPEPYSPSASATQITNINQLLPDGDYRLWTYDPNFNSWGSGLSGKGSQFIKKWDKIVERNEQQVTKKAIFHFNDDPRSAKVEYAQMEPNLVENGEEIPVEKINWDTGKLKRIKRYSLSEQFNPVFLYEGAEGQSFYITSVDWQDLGKLYYVVPPSENPLEYPFDYQTEGIAFDYKLKDLIKSIENNGLSYKLYDPQAILHNDDFQYEIYSDYRVWKTFLDYANVYWHGSPDAFEDEEVFSSADWQNAVKYGVEFKWEDIYDDYKKKKATFHPKNAQSELSVVYEFLKWLEEKKSKGMARFLESTSLETIFGEGEYPSVQEIKAHFESKDTVQDVVSEPVIIEEKMEVQTKSPVQESIGSWSFNYDDCSIRFERMQVK